MPDTAYLSLGANIGDREANISSAISALDLNDSISVQKVASLYETEPYGEKDQPLFINTIIAIETDLKPFDLLDVIQKIESLLGRPVERKKNGPRIIDIDIICFGTAFIDTDALTIPHPLMALRKFVLVPLCEIAPDYKVPLIKKTVEELLNLCPDTSKVTKFFPEKSA